MKSLNYQVGKYGEEMARDYLIKKGYKLIDKNFKNRFGEIDLIMSASGKLVFVEVKLKIGKDFGSPEEMINKRKMFQIRKTAEFFLLKNREVAVKFPIYRIDAVCIVLDKENTVQRLSHYENIGF